MTELFSPQKFTSTNSKPDLNTTTVWRPNEDGYTGFHTKTEQ